MQGKSFEKMCHTSAGSPCDYNILESCRLQCALMLYRPITKKIG